MQIARNVDHSRLPSRSDAGVTFRFAGSARMTSVALAGTFNSWVGDACMLERVSGSEWCCKIALTPGRHLYKYVIDGQEWIPDPDNPWISEDGQNNSCVSIDLDGAVFVRSRGIDAAAPGLLHRHPALASPSWLRDAVVYQLSVRAFGGNFAGVQARLGYLADLGVNTIWMMPIHPIGAQERRGSLGDPYAVRDFATIDPALGSAAALRELVATAHARGMRILFDWTLNRSSIDHPLVTSHPHWYTRDASGAPYYAVPNRAYFAGFDFSQRDLRIHLIGAMREWITKFGFDGIRFDDSDITPTDFLEEIRTALAADRPDIAIISQAYDELHHLASCDLTYEGGTRELLRQVTCGAASATEFAQYWNESTYSFPRNALRLRWLEEKEQARADAVFGRPAHLAAAAIVLALDGVPHLLMGQEFGEAHWRDWTVLFDDWQLDWAAFDADVFDHYRALIWLRREHAALRRGELHFIDALPDGVIGVRRVLDGTAIDVYANLRADAAELSGACGQTLYGRGWLAPHTLAGHGCVVMRTAVP